MKKHKDITDNKQIQRTRNSRLFAYEKVVARAGDLDRYK
jgi:hypothetical protein